MQFFTPSLPYKFLKTLWCVFVLMCVFNISYAQNANNGGTISSNQTVCPGETPEPFTSTSLPSGGDPNLPIEYLWMVGTINSFPGSSWMPAPGINNLPTYNPPAVGTTTFFVRCARRAGFSSFPAESNVVSITVLPSPFANIVSKPTSVFTGSTVNLAASFSPGASYAWDFNGDGFPDCFGQNCSFTYNTAGTFPVTLTVTNNFGCTSLFSSVINVTNPSGNNGIDPCNCNDPLNFALNSTTFLNHDFILINSNPGENWSIGNLAIGNIFSNTGAPIPPGTNIPEVSPGVYYLDIFFDGTMGYSLVSTNGVSSVVTGPGMTTTCGCLNPLPIDLVSFDASLDGDKVQLKWVTSSEINNSHFVLERSLDGIRFEELGQVAGAGNSSETLIYSFSDERPFDGINYYRLLQVDFDGTSEYFEVITIKTDNEGMVFNIFPNPVKNIANLQLDENISSEAHVEILNINGKLIEVLPINQIGGTKEVNVSNLVSGVYFLRLVDRGINEKITRRLIKQ